MNLLQIFKETQYKSYLNCLDPGNVQLNNLNALVLNVLTSYFFCHAQHMRTAQPKRPIRLGASLPISGDRAGLKKSQIYIYIKR